jgi:hypothetical protein
MQEQCSQTPKNNAWIENNIKTLSAADISMINKSWAFFMCLIKIIITLWTIFIPKKLLATSSYNSLLVLQKNLIISNNRLQVLCDMLDLDPLLQRTTKNVS